MPLQNHVCYNDDVAAKSKVFAGPEARQKRSVYPQMQQHPTSVSSGLAVMYTPFYLSDCPV